MALLEDAVRGWGAEVVFITSNEQGNREMMEGCTQRGIPNFGWSARDHLADTGLTRELDPQVFCSTSNVDDGDDSIHFTILCSSWNIRLAYALYSILSFHRQNQPRNILYHSLIHSSIPLVKMNVFFSPCAALDAPWGNGP